MNTCDPLAGRLWDAELQLVLSAGSCRGNHWILDSLDPVTSKKISKPGSMCIYESLLRIPTSHQFDVETTNVNSESFVREYCVE